LVNSCLKFKDGKYISQICGGKINVEGDLPEPTALITMLPGGYKLENGKTEQSPEIKQVESPPLEDLKIKFLDYIAPDIGDVDITSEKLLVAVGRGIQTEDNLELANELAEILGGTVCASRPVVDQGWLPISRMIGKSGKIVKPKLYLALGISGAPEHVEGIMDSENIIAINTDPSAPIFEIATYGAQVDLLDLTEILIEELEAL
jgi:electron transfer flavoprotein alpha subunit